MNKTHLEKRFPPSQPCSCEICLSYCQRPGWWSVEQAAMALAAGYANRMMLEIAPEFTFGVLSPAFKGNEGNFSLHFFAKRGCTFLNDNLCELFGTGLQPLECRFTHHTRQGLGPVCHSALEKDWYGKEGQRLILQWNEITHAFDWLGLIFDTRYNKLLDKSP